MPKAKRRENILGFGRKSSGNYIPASGGIAKHAPKHRAKASGASDSKYDDVAKSLAGKPYKSLSTSQQATVRGIASKMNPKRKRKRNLEIGLPKNKWANAKVRMKGGKIQVMANERVLGKAGFKAGAGLSGVSVSGGAKLNPKRRKNWFGFGKSKAKSSGIEKGDSVKIIRGGERFWVTVTSVRGSKITGKVDNHLVLKHPFRFGSKISFGKASVIEHQK